MISIIVAVAENGVIGKDNSLAWHLPADMKFFKEKTTGHCVITGRKNYESIPEKFRPLPNRTNIVVTRQPDYLAPGAKVVDSLEYAIAVAKAEKLGEIFIIGGGEIYKQSLPHADRVYLTRIEQPFEGDVFFPELDSAWKLKDTREGEVNEKNVYSHKFLMYERCCK